MPRELLLLFGFLQEAGGAGAKPPTPSGEARHPTGTLNKPKKTALPKEVPSILLINNLLLKG